MISPMVVRHRPPNVPTIVMCFVYLCIVRYRTRRGDLRGALAKCRHLADNGSSDCDTATVDRLIARSVHRVSVAGALFPGRARCLEQSIVVCQILRSTGISAELKIGVQPHRFRAHAWVEYNGRVINEDGGRLFGFVTFPEIPA